MIFSWRKHVALADYKLHRNSYAYVRGVRVKGVIR